MDSVDLTGASLAEARREIEAMLQQGSLTVHTTPDHFAALAAAGFGVSGPV